MINQRNFQGLLVEPAQKVPVVLIQDFIDPTVVFPLQNKYGTGFGTIYSLIVGAGNHSQVKIFIFEY